MNRQSINIIHYLIAMLIILIILHFPYSDSQIENGHSKIVLIRADDFYRLTPGWKWITNLINSEGISATYAIIPGYIPHTGNLKNQSIQFLNDLDKRHFELATHGLNHENFKGLSYEDQYALINQATNIMTSEFYRPRTFVPPSGGDDNNTIEACNALGYHSISGNYVSGAQGIAQFVPELFWENNWTATGTTHSSFSDFKFVFDRFYNSSAKTLTIVLHPSTYEDTNGNLRTDDANVFAQSIDYMKGKNVEFMTIDQAYIEEQPSSADMYS